VSARFVLPTAGGGRPSNFANRYDATNVAKKISALREIIPNRFDAPRVVLLIKSVLSAHVRFTRDVHPVCEGRFASNRRFDLLTSSFAQEGARIGRERRKLMRRVSAAYQFSAFDTGTAIA
jgi:hypothetical protein